MWASMNMNSSISEPHFVVQISQFQLHEIAQKCSNIWILHPNLKFQEKIGESIFNHPVFYRYSICQKVAYFDQIDINKLGQDQLKLGWFLYTGVGRIGWVDLVL